jgi:hypothetical protein
MCWRLTASTAIGDILSRKVDGGAIDLMFYYASNQQKLDEFRCKVYSWDVMVGLGVPNIPSLLGAPDVLLSNRLSFCFHTPIVHHCSDFENPTISKLCLLFANAPTSHVIPYFD